MRLELSPDELVWRENTILPAKCSVTFAECPQTLNRQRIFFSAHSQIRHTRSRVLAWQAEHLASTPHLGCRKSAVFLPLLLPFALSYHDGPDPCKSSVALLYDRWLGLAGRRQVRCKRLCSARQQEHQQQLQPPPSFCVASSALQQ